MKKPKTPHTAFWTGSRIRIVFTDGAVKIAKYKEKLGNKKIRTEEGDFLVKDIRSISYYKPLPHEM